MPNLDDIITKLSRLKPIPVALVVYLDGDPNPKRVDVPNVRQRWRRVETVLANLAWARIEAVGRGDTILAVLVNDDDDAAPPVAPGAGLTIRERELADVVLLAFKQAHQMFCGMFGTLLQSMNAQVQQQTHQTKLVAQSYERMIQVQQQTMELGAGGDDETGMGGLVQALVARELVQRGVIGKPAHRTATNPPPNRPKGKPGDRTAPPASAPSGGNPHKDKS